MLPICFLRCVHSWPCLANLVGGDSGPPSEELSSRTAGDSPDSAIDLGGGDTTLGWTVTWVCPRPNSSMQATFRGQRGHG